MARDKTLTIKIEIVGLDDALRRLRKAPQVFAKEMNRSLVRSAIIYQKQARKEMLPNVDTGFAWNNIVYNRPRMLSITIESRADYSIPLHEGHGSFAGNPYFDKALKRVDRRINAELSKGIERALAKL